MIKKFPYIYVLYNEEIVAEYTSQFTCHNFTTITYTETKASEIRRFFLTVLRILKLNEHL